MSIPVSPLYLFPPVAWWRATLPYGEVRLNAQSPFRKMHFYNRYRIATANGPLLLSVPLQGGRTVKAPLGEVRIDYNQDWQKQHWRSLFSAYGRAPFFEHYGPALEHLLMQKHERLAALNLAVLQWIKGELKLTNDFLIDEQASTGGIELSPAFAEGGKEIRYPQVFEDRHGFLPNLSILDLLMNEGPAAKLLLC